MYKIGIISKPGRELTTVRAELSPYGYFSIDTFTDAPNAVSILKTQTLNSLVIILESFTLKQLDLVRKLGIFTQICRWHLWRFKLILMPKNKRSSYLV